MANPQMIEGKKSSRQILCKDNQFEINIVFLGGLVASLSINRPLSCCINCSTFIRKNKFFLLFKKTRIDFSRDPSIRKLKSWGLGGGRYFVSSQNGYIKSFVLSTFPHWDAKKVWLKIMQVFFILIKDVLLTEKCTYFIILMHIEPWGFFLTWNKKLYLFIY